MMSSVANVCLNLSNLTSLPCLYSFFFSYITINHQPYIAFHFSKNVFVCYFCPFLSTKLFLHNYNVMAGSEM